MARVGGLKAVNVVVTEAAGMKCFFWVVNCKAPTSRFDYLPGAIYGISCSLFAILPHIHFRYVQVSDPISDLVLQES